MKIAIRLIIAALLLISKLSLAGEYSRVSDGRILDNTTRVV